MGHLTMDEIDGSLESFAQSACIVTLIGHSDWVWSLVELKTGEVLSGSGLLIYNIQL
jgi:hypothetical protein